MVFATNVVLIDKIQEKITHSELLVDSSEDTSFCSIKLLIFELECQDWHLKQWRLLFEPDNQECHLEGKLSAKQTLIFKLCFIDGTLWFVIKGAAVALNSTT